jgi:two-component system, OmpR family, KDP operon response regulator KdpE
MKRVLVIDDEAPIRRLLEIALAGLGWEVLCAATGTEGLEAARADKPDVALLDLNLPDMGGLELLERLRGWSSLPVIVISVRDSEADIVRLLNAGADDYVVKPFYTNVLAARIEAIQRRRDPGAEPVLRSGPLSVDLSRREVRLGGEGLHLTPTEYALLALLARYPGRIVTRDVLLREVWGPSGEAEEGNLRFYVNSLRKKIESDPASPRLIRTEPGVGYRLDLISPEGEEAQSGQG